MTPEPPNENQAYPATSSTHARSRLATLIVAALAITAIVVVSLFWSAIVVKWDERLAVRAIERFDPNRPVAFEKVYGINTFDTRCSSEVIRRYYETARQALAAKSPDLKTYFWEDQEGYPRIDTILQTATGYVVVEAAGNNDNDSVSVRFQPGKFEKPKMKLLPSCTLPKGVLRPG